MFIYFILHGASLMTNFFKIWALSKLSTLCRDGHGWKIRQQINKTILDNMNASRCPCEGLEKGCLHNT